MTVLCKLKKQGNIYQIRQSGSTTKLLTNGVLHSQINSRSVATGSVWDLLWIGLFFRENPQPKRALILGLGAGTVVNQLCELFSGIEIVAVENDAVHVDLAEKFFGMKKFCVNIVLSEAKSFLENYRGPKFDIVIDDLFIGNAGIPRRAINCDSNWFDYLQRCVLPKGIISINFSDYEEVKRSAVFTKIRKRNRFKSAFFLRSPDTENVVTTLISELVVSRDLRKSLKRNSKLSNELDSGKIKYHIRIIK
tara:strand:- start:750 stop:1499 length:750 start_codon:yes stop_codon:yes gene_type:complete